MAMLSKYGNLTTDVAHFPGRVFWVAPSSPYYIDGKSYEASDNNDGLSPDRALATVARGVALTKLLADGSAATASTNYGDVIVLLPGTHTATANLAMSQAGVTLMGLPGVQPANSYAVGGSVKNSVPITALTCSASATTIFVSAADVTIANLRLYPKVANACISFTTAASRLRLVNCMLDLATTTNHNSNRGMVGESSASAGTDATQAPVDIQVVGCYIKEANGGTSNGAALDLSAAVNFLVSDCYIYKEFTASSVAWTLAVQVNDNTSGVFDNNVIFCTGGGAGDAITAGIKGASLTGASVVSFKRNLVGVNVTSPFTGFAAADCDLGLNYVATAAGGSGGSLITSTT